MKWFDRSLLAMAAVATVLFFALVLSGCTSPGTIVRDVPVEVRVPVPQPCAGKRPQPVAPLKKTIPPKDWHQRDVRQKAAAVGKQALDRQTYGEQLNAATAACPTVAPEAD